MQLCCTYNMTKFGVNGFTEALRQETTKKHLRVGALKPGAVEIELISHDNDTIKATNNEYGYARDHAHIAIAPVPPRDHGRQPPHPDPKAFSRNISLSDCR